MATALSASGVEAADAPCPAWPAPWSMPAIPPVGTMITYITAIAALLSSRWVGCAPQRSPPTGEPRGRPRWRSASRRTAHTTPSAPKATPPAVGGTRSAVAGSTIAAIPRPITTWLASAAAAARS